MRTFIVFVALLFAPLLSFARGGTGTTGSALYFGGGFSHMNLTIQNKTTSSDFNGSGFNLGAGYDYKWNDIFGVQIVGQYSEGRVLNDSETTISDDARIFAKSFGGGLIFGNFAIGAGQSMADIKIVPISSPGLKYKYSPKLNYYYANLNLDYHDLLRTQLGMRLSSGMADELKFTEMSFYLNLMFLIPGI